MASLKPLVPKAESFSQRGSRPTVVKSPRVRVYKLDDMSRRCWKGLLFGSWGTGKSYALYYLLRLGYKVVCLTTDIGGDGLNTVALQLKREDLRELGDNLRIVAVNDYEACRDWIKDPDPYFVAADLESMYTFDPDFIFWDGFSGFQQIDLSTYVAEDLAPDQNQRKGEISQARQSGLQFEQVDWGMIRNATIRAVDDFLKMQDPKTGKIYHKLVTCAEAIRSREGKKGLLETAQPLLQGAGGILMGAGFDVIWRTVGKTTGAGNKAKTKFVYETKPDATDRMAKDRGFNMPPEVDANFDLLLIQMLQDLDIPLPSRAQEVIDSYGDAAHLAEGGN